MPRPASSTPSRLTDCVAERNSSRCRRPPVRCAFDGQPADRHQRAIRRLGTRTLSADGQSRNVPRPPIFRCGRIAPDRRLGASCRPRPLHGLVRADRRILSAMFRRRTGRSAVLLPVFRHLTRTAAPLLRPRCAWNEPCFPTPVFPGLRSHFRGTIPETGLVWTKIVTRQWPGRPHGQAGSCGRRRRQGAGRAGKSPDPRAAEPALNSTLSRLGRTKSG